MENMKSQTGGTRSGYPRFDIFFVILNTFSMSNMSLYAPPRRWALYRSCGHVRPRHSRGIDSILIVRRSTISVAECGTASLFIIGEGSGKHPPTVSHSVSLTMTNLVTCSFILSRWWLNAVILIVR